MAQIVSLSDYRKTGSPRRAGGAATAPAHGKQNAPHYFCLRCDTDQFKLFPAGTVHCAHCGALMRNITVSDKASS